MANLVLNMVLVALSYIGLLYSFIFMPQVCVENFQGLFQILIIITILCFILCFQVLAVNPIDAFSKSIDYFVNKFIFFSKKI